MKGGYRILGALAPVTLLFSSPAHGAEPKRDPERSFHFLDFNADGMISRDEFAQLKETVPFFKEHPLSIGVVFWKFDTNKDSKLSLEEFRTFVLSRAKEEPAKKNKELPAAEQPRGATAEDIAFFEKKIRPVLADTCYECHSAESKSVKGGLLLDSRDGIRIGGDSGPAIIQGNPNESLLLEAVRYGNKELQMPPQKHGGKLPDHVIKDLEHWVQMGAPDPREGTKPMAGGINLEEGRKHWSFQPLSHPKAPTPHDGSWPRKDIDRFVLSKLEASGIAPVEDATIQTLVRRLSFDLTGLPPSTQVLDKIKQTSSSSFVDEYVNELLSSSAFGERWARHWLDVARYADSSGRGSNLLFPNAWRYRDYVIDSFNQDKPYDQFLREQIAGDLLPASSAAEKNTNLIATGFLSIGPKQLDERDSLQFKLDIVDEQLDTMGQAMLGLTIGCARCHDHKFDAIPQKDYYALAGIFQSTETLYGTVGVITNGHPSGLNELDFSAPRIEAKFSRAQLKTEVARIERQIKELYGSTAPSSFRLPDDPQKARESIAARSRLAIVSQRLKETAEDGHMIPLAMGVRDAKNPANMPLYSRGDPTKPLATVTRGFPQVLPEASSLVNETSSGRRELADWIASPLNPLTARVYVNRVWQHLLGRGLVATPDNFGGSGEPASHPELLDHLAAEFIAHGWSLKWLVREIVLSRTYQLSSHISSTAYALDPDNVLLWRMSPRRLNAEATRDAMLTVAGTLQPQPPVGSIAARVGDGFAALASTFESKETEAGYRSIYLTVLRDQTNSVLRIFDFANPNAVTGRREETTTPAQALFLLNHPLLQSLAEAWSLRLSSTHESQTAQISTAYRQAFARDPSIEEIRNSEDFIEKMRASERGSRTENQEIESAGKRNNRALTTFCHALLVSAEFRILQ
jgi:cytochrome c553